MGLIEQLTSSQPSWKCVYQLCDLLFKLYYWNPRPLDHVGHQLDILAVTGCNRQETTPLNFIMRDT